MDGLIEGRMVHYVMETGNYGSHRPAIIVRVWSQDNGCSNLQVFIDGTNDGGEDGIAHLWKTSRAFDDQEKKPGTWHWIERA